MGENEPQVAPEPVPEPVEPSEEPAPEPPRKPLTTEPSLRGRDRDDVEFKDARHRDDR